MNCAFIPLLDAVKVLYYYFVVDSTITIPSPTQTKSIPKLLLNVVFKEYKP